MPSQSEIMKVMNNLVLPLGEHYGKHLPEPISELVCRKLAGMSENNLKLIYANCTYLKKTAPDLHWILDQAQKLSQLAQPESATGNVGNGLQAIYAREEKAREHNREYAQRWMLNNPSARQADAQGWGDYLQRYVEAFVWPISQRMHDIRNVGYDHAMIFGMNRKYDQAEEHGYWQHVSDCLNSGVISVVIPSWLEEHGRIHARISNRRVDSSLAKTLERVREDQPLLQIEDKREGAA